MGCDARSTLFYGFVLDKKESQEVLNRISAAYDDWDFDKWLSELYDKILPDINDYQKYYPLMSIKSSDSIRTNGNLVKLTKNNIRVILKHNTTYKYRIRLRINGEWQAWTETATFRTRDKDYKYTR